MKTNMIHSVIVKSALLASLMLTGCGGGGGGAGKGGSEGTGTFLGGLKGKTVIAQLSTDEANQLCSRYTKRISDDLGKELVCNLLDSVVSVVPLIFADPKDQAAYINTDADGKFVSFNPAAADALVAQCQPLDCSKVKGDGSDLSCALRINDTLKDCKGSLTDLDECLGDTLAASEDLAASFECGDWSDPEAMLNKLEATTGKGVSAACNRLRAACPNQFSKGLFSVEVY